MKMYYGDQEIERDYYGECYEGDSYNQEGRRKYTDWFTAYSRAVASQDEDYNNLSQIDMAVSIDAWGCWQ